MGEWLSDEERAKLEKDAWIVRLEACLLGGMMLFLALDFLFG